MQNLMNIDDKTISYLEDLSNLTLSDDEKPLIKSDLNTILQFMGQIVKLDTGSTAACSVPFSKVNVFRDDEVKPSFPRELILKNAPYKNDEMYIAPKTVE